MKRKLSRKILCFAGFLIVFTLSLRFRYMTLNASSQKDATNTTNTNHPVLSNAYGAVIDSQTNEIPGAVVDKVVLYSQKEAAQSQQRIERPAILVRYPQAKGTILICHGFMCDKFDIGFLRNIFKSGEYNVMTFDFRAHGEKVESQCCTLGRDEAYDVIAAARFLKEHPALQGIPLLAYAFSMGAVAAIEAQAKDPLFTGMVLDCPFNSSEKVIQHNIGNIKYSLFGYEFEIPGKTILQKYALHPYIQSFVKTVLRTVSRMDTKNINTHVCHVLPVESIKKVQVPCYFIHCKNDEMVPLTALKEVYNGAQGFKKLWVTNGRRHYDSYFYNPEKYTYNVRTFINQVIAGDLQGTSGEILEDGADIFAHEQKTVAQQ